MQTMKPFAERISNIPESFIREILKVSTQKEMISFAGGLPNPALFPVEAMALAAEKVLRLDGRTALQYAPTEGYLPLRAWIAERQAKITGVTVSPESLIMLSGSQQGLDLTGKLFIEKNSKILLEDPSYLGAIQAFSAYQPEIHTVPIGPEGPDTNEFNHIKRRVDPLFFYCVPNFQNPTGYCYDASRRVELVEKDVYGKSLWIEDDPYGDICFTEKKAPSFFSLMPHKTLHLGSFSKILSPGLRLGWATGPEDVIRKMVIAKQASDLHSGNLSQRIVYQFLIDNDLDAHIENIKSFYKSQADFMHSLMKEQFPEEVCWKTPTGGMFLWVILPGKMNAAAILKKAIENGVLFVPGENFFVGTTRGENTLRLNFSNPTREEMQKGVRVLANILRSAIDDSRFHDD